MRRLWFLLLLLLAGAAGFCFVSGRKARAPLFEGKPLDQWLDAGYEDASRVLYEVGPDAVEWIFTKLKHEDSRYGHWGLYRAAWDKLPVCCRDFLPRPRASGFDEWRACNALLAIGPRAIPSLAVSLQDRHFLVRCASARTLGLFRQRGSNLRGAMPALQAALHDLDPAVRKQAAEALGEGPKLESQGPKTSDQTGQTTRTGRT